MRARHAILGAVVWLIASAAISPRACEAGFLAANEVGIDLLNDAGMTASGDMTAAGDQLPADSQPTQSNAWPLQVMLANPSPFDAGSTSSTGSMLRLTGSGVYALLPSQDEFRQLPAAERLLVEESRLFPAVYLSRVFRPPRV